jgi:hypothetical protein
MPRAFHECQEKGGKVRAKKIDKTHSIPVCIPPGGGKSVGGEVHTKKVAPKRRGSGK